MKDKYLLLGDGKVVGNWSEGCAACLGEMMPMGEAAASTSNESRIKRAMTRGNRRSLLSLQVLPPVVDGILSQESNYTGFVILSGKLPKVVVRSVDYQCLLMLYSKASCTGK